MTRIISRIWGNNTQGFMWIHCCRNSQKEERLPHVNAQQQLKSACSHVCFAQILYFGISCNKHMGVWFSCIVLMILKERLVYSYWMKHLDLLLWLYFPFGNMLYGSELMCTQTSTNLSFSPSKHLIFRRNKKRLLLCPCPQRAQQTTVWHLSAGQHMQHADKLWGEKRTRWVRWSS